MTVSGQSGTDYALIAEEAVDQLARSPLASMAAILIVALMCFLPGLNTLPPMDGVEPGTVVAAREMLATGDPATIRLQTENATWAPRGVVWLEAASAWISGKGTSAPIWVYRIPSLLGGLAAALLAWWVAIAFDRPRAALMTGLLLAGSGLLGLEARLAVPDAILLAVTTLAAGTLARLWRAKESTHWVLAFLFWTSVGVGAVVGGLPAPAIALATVVVLSFVNGSFEWTRRLRPLPGLVWFLVILSPWLVASAVAAFDGAWTPPSAEALRRIGAIYAPVAPPGMYTLLVPLVAGPAITFFFLGVPWLVDNIKRPVVVFALAWGLPYWIAIELIPTKLPHLALPAVPAIALMAATAVDVGAARIRGWASWFYSLGPIVWPPVLAVTVPVAFYLVEGTFPLVGFIALAIGAGLGPVAWFWLRRGRAVAAVALSVVSAIFIYLGFFGLILPGFNGIRIAERIAAIGESSSLCDKPLYAVSGYPEESLVFVAGRETRLLDAAGAADFVNSGSCRVVAIDTSQISSFRQRAEDLGVELTDRGVVSGFNLDKLRRVDIHVFTESSSE